MSNILANKKAYSNKFRVHRKTWLEIDEINEENFRMVQNKEPVFPIIRNSVIFAALFTKTEKGN